MAEHFDLAFVLRQLEQEIGDSEYVPCDSSDEHLRYELYKRASRCDKSIGLLLGALALETDVAMATAAIFELIERLDSDSLEAAQRVAPEATKSQVATRVNETRLLRGLGTGQDSPQEIDALMAASDWAQRTALEVSPTLEVIGALSNRGRTKRVRRVAGEMLGRQTSDP